MGDHRTRINRRMLLAGYTISLSYAAYCIAIDGIRDGWLLLMPPLALTCTHLLMLHAADRLHPIEDVRLWWMTRGR